MTVHNLLFCVHTLCMSYVTKTSQLVSSSVSSKQLFCCLHGQGQNREQKQSDIKRELPNSAVNAESVTAFQANAMPTIRQYCNAM